VLEVRIRPTGSLGERLRDGADLLVERLVEMQLDTRGARDQPHRAIVVRGAQPAGDHAEVGAHALP
jgi:hypothetical protein